MSRAAGTALLCILLLLPPSISKAEEFPAPLAEQPKAAPDSFNLWFSPGMVSYHFDRSAGFRNLNNGFGIQTNVSENLSLMAGNFINSDSTRSSYAGLAWQPLSWHAFKIGFSAGVLDGYQDRRDGGGFVTLLPWISIRNERVDLNLTAIPSSLNRPVAVSVQMILRVW